MKLPTQTTQSGKIQRQLMIMMIVIMTMMMLVAFMGSSAICDQPQAAVRPVAMGRWGRADSSAQILRSLGSLSSSGPPSPKSQLQSEAYARHKCSLRGKWRVPSRRVPTNLTPRELEKYEESATNPKARVPPNRSHSRTEPNPGPNEVAAGTTAAPSPTQKAKMPSAVDATEDDDVDDGGHPGEKNQNSISISEERPHAQFPVPSCQFPVPSSRFVFRVHVRGL
ncbi:hypothetical protein ACLKA7_003196 [Drosophila subpalustris]